MRSATVSVLVAAALAAGPTTALAQTAGDPVSGAAAELPPTLFEPPSDGVPARAAADDPAGAPALVAALLLAGAVAAGYFTGSSRRTRRS